ncbi:SLAP domain-containing protein [Haloimpatiens sp. FM7315]|uniref:SLAP domain-containing protein n=1 Tax=Haloimpatiens sp. FM7315 TaxID=3298609 RepID=UPI00370B6837
MFDKTKEFDVIKDTDVNKLKASIIDIKQTEKGLKVLVELINTFSEEIGFTKTSFVIMNSKNELLAYKELELEKIHSLPPKSVESISIFFGKENIYNSTFNTKDIKMHIDTSNIIKDIEKYREKTLETSALFNIEKPISLTNIGNYDFSDTVKVDLNIMKTINEKFILKAWYL